MGRGEFSALRARFALDERLEVRRRFNVAPGDDVVAVRTGRDGAAKGDVLRWGLVPHWADSAKLGSRMINARAETLAEKPAFRDALSRRRCLVLADGFYEWERREGARRQPWWITRADGEPFAFAGLWATWRPHDADADADADVLPLRSCTIITAEANATVAPLHDRMPVILPVGAEAEWLDPATSAAAAQALLRPLAPAETDLRPVGSAVNDARHDEPDCLDPPAAADEPAPTLF